MCKCKKYNMTPQIVFITICGGISASADSTVTVSLRNRHTKVALKMETD